MKVTIRDDEYTVDGITEHDILALTECLQQQDSEGIRKAKDLLLEIIPGLAESGLIRGTRFLLLMPELFLLVSDLQEALLNSPEYAAAKSRLSTVKGGDEVLKAIEKMSPVQPVTVQPADPLKAEIDELKAKLAALQAA
jgi:hypothetical protein